MNSTILNRIGRLACAAGVIFLTASTGTAATNAAALHTEEFGIRSGDPVGAGYVFVDGQYLDKPYVVARRGLALFVNDRLVRPPVEWPPRDLRVFEDPKLPDGIDKKSNFEDLEDKQDRYNGYLSRKARFLRLRFPDQFAQKTAEAYRQLPFVEAAVVDKDGSEVIVKTLRGETRRIATCAIFPDSPLVSPSPTKEQVLTYIEGERVGLEQEIRRGEALFLFANGQRMGWGAQKANQDMPYLLKLIESTKSVQEKVEELDDLDLLRGQRAEWWYEFVANLAVTPQLRSRVQALGVNLGEWEQKRRAETMRKKQEDRQAEQMRNEQGK